MEIHEHSQDFSVKLYETRGLQPVAPWVLQYITSNNFWISFSETADFQKWSN